MICKCHLSPVFKFRMGIDMLNIVLPDTNNVTYGDIDFSPLNKYGNVTTYEISETSELADRLADADIVLCNKTLLNRQTLEKATHLKYIGLFSTGYNNVDLAYAKEKGIRVCNAANYSTDSVAQHTFALILNFYNKIREYATFTEQGEWKKCKTFTRFAYEMHELKGNTLGIIGYGNIGKQVSKIALAFGMNVLVSSRHKDVVNEYLVKEFHKEYESGEIKFADISDIQRESDIITLHCPLNQDNEKMIDETFLSKCKSNLLLINTARGGLVDEEALIDALNTKKIAGAGIDVIDVEPMSEDCILIGGKNLTITPHIAWAPLETRQRLVDIVCHNLQAFLGGKPENVIV